MWLFIKHNAAILLKDFVTSKQTHSQVNCPNLFAQIVFIFLPDAWYEYIGYDVADLIPSPASFIQTDGKQLHHRTRARTPAEQSE